MADKGSPDVSAGNLDSPATSNGTQAGHSSLPIGALIAIVLGGSILLFSSLAYICIWLSRRRSLTSRRCPEQGGFDVYTEHENANVAGTWKSVSPPRTLRKKSWQTSSSSRSASPVHRLSLPDIPPLFSRQSALNLFGDEYERMRKTSWFDEDVLHGPAVSASKQQKNSASGEWPLRNLTPILPKLGGTQLHGHQYQQQQEMMMGMSVGGYGRPVTPRKLPQPPASVVTARDRTYHTPPSFQKLRLQNPIIAPRIGGIAPHHAVAARGRHPSADSTLSMILQSTEKRLLEGAQSGSLRRDRSSTSPSKSLRSIRETPATETEQVTPGTLPSRTQPQTTNPKKTPTFENASASHKRQISETSIVSEADSMFASPSPTLELPMGLTSPNRIRLSSRDEGRQRLKVTSPRGSTSSGGLPTLYSEDERPEPRSNKSGPRRGSHLTATQASQPNQPGSTTALEHATKGGGSPKRQSNSGGGTRPNSRVVKAPQRPGFMRKETFGQSSGAIRCEDEHQSYTTPRHSIPKNAPQPLNPTPRQSLEPSLTARNSSMCHSRISSEYATSPWASLLVIPAQRRASAAKNQSCSKTPAESTLERPALLITSPSDASLPQTTSALHAASVESHDFCTDDLTRRHSDQDMQFSSALPAPLDLRPKRSSPTLGHQPPFHDVRKEPMPTVPKLFVANPDLVSDESDADEDQDPHRRSRGPDDSPSPLPRTAANRGGRRIAGAQYQPRVVSSCSSAYSQDVRDELASLQTRAASPIISHLGAPAPTFRLHGSLLGGHAAAARQSTATPPPASQPRSSVVAGGPRALPQLSRENVRNHLLAPDNAGKLGVASTVNMLRRMHSGASSAASGCGGGSSSSGTGGNANAVILGREAQDSPTLQPFGDDVFVQADLPQNRSSAKKYYRGLENSALAALPLRRGGGPWQTRVPEKISPLRLPGAMGRPGAGFLGTREVRDIGRLSSESLGFHDRDRFLKEKGAVARKPPAASPTRVPRRPRI